DGTALAGASCASRGFVCGTLGCNASTCQYDTSGCKSSAAQCSACGNNICEGAEVCNGTCLNGNTCQTQGFAGGTLGCRGDCSGYDTSGCHQCETCRDCNNQAC